MPPLADPHRSFILSSMQPIIKGAIPVLPAADAAESLKWWTEACGFKETFRDATPLQLMQASTAARRTSTSLV